MSVEMEFLINGVKVNPPENWKSLEVEVNYDKDHETVKPHISLKDLNWVRENTDWMLQYIEDGTSTGPGIFEAPSLKIRLNENGTIEDLFDGYIEICNGQFSKINSNVPIKERQGIDWFTDVADSFTFEYLYKGTNVPVNAAIDDDDFVAVPYVLNSVPDYKEAAIALITTYFIAKELRDAIKELAKLAAQASNPFTAPSAIIALVLEVLYIIALIASLINLIKEIILFLIQPVKYHMGMSFKKMCEKGAEYLGLKFKSEIFDEEPYSKLYLIPEKFTQLPNPSEPRIFNFTTPDKTKQDGYFKGTYGQFMRALKTMFCAKIEIRTNPNNGDRELHLLREDKTIGSPQFQMPPISETGEHIKFSIPVDTFYSNYSVEFAWDVTDKNTIQEFTGTIYQAILNPIWSIDKSLVMMKGLREERIPFALAKRKTELTVPEKICDAFLTVFNTLLNGIIGSLNTCIGVINAITKVLNTIKTALNTIGIKWKYQIKAIPNIPMANLNNLIDNRIGMMKIEHDHFTVPKAVLLDVAANPKNTKITATNSTDLSAEKLYDLFHFVRSWYPTLPDLPYGNQKTQKTFDKVKFTKANYLQVKGCSFCFLPDGIKTAELVSVKWKPYSQRASITLREPKLITNNLILEKLIPDGK